MFNKVLIANRGEIAVRIIRSLRDMGIASVAVYSEEDKSSLHVQLADEAICIGPAKSKDSYLNIVNILSAATISGADAIHPGFGFLSENPRFAKMCEECKIKFIGPSHSVIDMMGDKSKAKEIMSQNNIPIIPGSDGPLKGIEEAKIIADEVGYPVLLKAASGGGGKGLRKRQSAIHPAARSGPRGGDLRRGIVRPGGRRIHRAAGQAGRGGLWQGRQGAGPAHGPAPARPARGPRPRRRRCPRLRDLPRPWRQRPRCAGR